MRFFCIVSLFIAGASANVRLDPITPVTVPVYKTGDLNNKTFHLNPGAKLAWLTCHDVEYQLFVHDPVQCIYISGFAYYLHKWECSNVHKIIETLRSSPHGDRTTFLDLGANIGAYTVPVAKSGFRVVGFEPLPYNQELLAANIGTFKLDQHVQIYPVGVSNTSSEVCIIGSQLFNSGNGIIGTCRKGSQTISTHTIDDVLMHRDLCYTVVKADIEGHELQAFKGALKTVFQSDCPPELILFEENNRESVEVKDFVESFGYQCSLIPRTRDYACTRIKETYDKNSGVSKVVIDDDDEWVTPTDHFYYVYDIIDELRGLRGMKPLPRKPHQTAFTHI